MKGLFKHFILPALLIGVVLIFWRGIMSNRYASTEESIKFIQEHINHRGELVDHNREINVNSIDDIKLFVKEKEIRLDFGEITMMWKPEDFVSKENRDLLAKINITMFKDKDTGMLRVFYGEEEIQRWVY